MANYFEDLEIGRTFQTAAIEILPDAAIAFARQWDPQPFHIDADVPDLALFSRTSASGLHTLVQAFRLCVDTGAFTPTAVAGLTLDNVTFHKPVFPNDAIRALLTVIDKRTSTSRAWLGIVTWTMQVTNQDGEQVLSMRFVNMIKRRPAATLTKNL